MKHNHAHAHAEHPRHDVHRENIFKLAISATLHCLIGCGIGEVAGMILATYWGLSMTGSMILAITLGFVFGFALGILPLLRKGISFFQSLKIVLLAEGLSIAVMEAFELFAQVAIPGVLNAGLTEGLFWAGMGASLIAGFAAALPVNYYMIKRGVRHHH